MGRGKSLPPGDSVLPLFLVRFRRLRGLSLFRPYFPNFPKEAQDQHGHFQKELSLIHSFTPTLSTSACASPVALYSPHEVKGDGRRARRSLDPCWHNEKDREANVVLLVFRGPKACRRTGRTGATDRDAPPRSQGPLPLRSAMRIVTASAVW